MKKRQIVIISVLFILVFLIGWKLYSNSQANAKKNNEKKENSRYARVIEVENVLIPIEIFGFGRVNPALSINVAPEVSGVIVGGEVQLKQGVKFRKGQVLFKVDDREAKLALKARKSSFLNLMAGALADIKIDFPDSYKKWEKFFNSIDVSKVFPELPETSTTQEKTFLASRNVLSEYYNIKKDEIRLSKYTIKAPFNGFFSVVMVQEGSFAGMGTPIATLSQVSDLEVVVPIDKENIYLINPGQKVNMKTRGNDMNWKGVVKRIEQQVNPNTQSINVYVVPTKQKEQMIPGMYLEVAIHAGEVENSFELPRKALGTDNNIYAIRDSVLFVVPVEVIKKNKDSYIVSGLNDGELIISEQSPNISEGQRIIPVK
jgi:RND family efflux transporter MFP subunit